MCDPHRLEAIYESKLCELELLAARGGLSRGIGGDAFSAWLGSNGVEHERVHFPTVVNLIFIWGWWCCAEGCAVCVFMGAEGKGEPYSGTAGLPARIFPSSTVCLDWTLNAPTVGEE